METAFIKSDPQKPILASDFRDSLDGVFSEPFDLRRTFLPQVFSSEKVLGENLLDVSRSGILKTLRFSVGKNQL